MIRILLFWVLGLVLVAEAVAEPAVVRRIVVVRDPIFSANDQARIPWLPLGMVNLLHIDTQERVIRRELVFGVGDRVDAGDLDEAERKLRATGYFAEAWVEPISVAPDTVDVMVQTQELWTTALNGSYEKFEDELLWALEIRERNFLGAAKQFRLSRRVDADRSTWSVGLGDRQLFGSRWQVQGRLSDSNDGDATSWSVARPYFRLESTWAFGAGYFHGGARPRFYISDGGYIRPRVDATGVNVYVGRRLATTTHGVWRGEVGIAASKQRFSPEPGLTRFEDSDDTFDLPADVRENRNVQGPYVTLHRVSSQFRRERFLFAMGRIEDLALGLEHRVQLGYATRLVDGSLSGLTFSLDEDWLTVSDLLAARAELDVDGILTGGDTENLKGQLQVSTFLRFTPQTQLALGVLGGTSSDLDRHNVFSLGPESGLRAAGFREFAGDRLVRSNAEFRWIYRPGILGLLTPGAIVFADVGAAWFEAERDLTWKLLRGAVGVGLRIGLNRATTNRPIRIDLGWPVFYDNDRSSPILTIGSGQVF